MDFYKIPTLPFYLQGQQGVRSRAGFCLSLVLIILMILYFVFILTQYLNGGYLSATMSSSPTKVLHLPIEYVGVRGSNGSTVNCSRDAIAAAQSYGLVYYDCFSLTNISQTTLETIASPYNQTCFVSYSLDPEKPESPFTPYFECTVIPNGILTSVSQKLTTDFGFFYELIEDRAEFPKVEFVPSNPFYGGLQYESDFGVIIKVKRIRFYILIASLSAIYSVIYGGILAVAGKFMKTIQVETVNDYITKKKVKRISPIAAFLSGLCLRKKEGKERLKEIDENHKDYLNKLSINNLVNLSSSMPELSEGNASQGDRKESSLPDLFSEPFIPLLINGKQSLKTKSGMVCSIVVLLFTLGNAIFLAIALFGNQDFQIVNSETIADNQGSTYELFVNATNSTIALMGANMTNCSAQFAEALSGKGYSGHCILPNKHVNNCPFTPSYLTFCWSTMTLDLTSKGSPFKYKVQCEKSGPFILSDNIYSVETDTNLFSSSPTNETAHIIKLILNMEYCLDVAPLTINASPLQYVYSRRYKKIPDILSEVLGIWTISFIIGFILIHWMVSLERSIILKKIQNSKAKNLVESYSLVDFLRGFLICRKRTLVKYTDLHSKMSNILNLDRIIGKGSDPEEAKNSQANFRVPFDIFASTAIPYVINGKQNLQTKTGKSCSLLLIVLIIAFIIYSIIQLATNDVVDVKNKKFLINNQQAQQLQNLEYYVTVTGTLVTSNYVDPHCSNDTIKAVAPLLNNSANFSAIYCSLVSGGYQNLPVSGFGWSREPPPGGLNIVVCTFSSKLDLKNLDAPLKKESACQAIPNDFHAGYFISLQSFLIKVRVDKNHLYEDIREYTGVVASVRFTKSFMTMYPDYQILYDYGYKQSGIDYLLSVQKLQTVIASIKGLWSLLLLIATITISKVVKIERSMIIYNNITKRPISDAGFYKGKLCCRRAAKEKQKEIDNLMASVNSHLELFEFISSKEQIKIHEEKLQIDRIDDDLIHDDKNQEGERIHSLEDSVKYIVVKSKETGRE